VLDHYGLGCFQDISAAIDIGGDGTFASICPATCLSCPINGVWPSHLSSINNSSAGASISTEIEDTLNVSYQLTAAEFLVLGDPSAHRSVSCASGQKLLFNCKISVSIHAVSHANEIEWSLGSMNQTIGSYPPAPNEDGSPYIHTIELSLGDNHTFTFGAVGPNGWHGGYWELANSCGEIVGGGPNQGMVNGTNGSFLLAGSNACCGTCIILGVQEQLLFKAGVIDLWSQWLASHPHDCLYPCETTELLGVPEGTVMTNVRCAMLARDTPCHLLILVFKLCGSYCGICQVETPYVPVTETQMCQPCSAGQYDTDGDPTTPCAMCPPGKFSSVIGATSCDGNCSTQSDLVHTCSFLPGSGTGGVKILVGYASTTDECIRLVRARRHEANGITFARDSRSTECYANIGMSGTDDNPRWQTCQLHAGLASEEECAFTYADIGYTSFEEPFVDTEDHFYDLAYEKLELDGNAFILENLHIALTGNATAQNGAAMYPLEMIGNGGGVSIEYQVNNGLLLNEDTHIACVDNDTAVAEHFGGMGLTSCAAGASFGGCEVYNTAYSYIIEAPVSVGMNASLAQAEGVLMKDFMAASCPIACDKCEENGSADTEYVQCVDDDTGILHALGTSCAQLGLFLPAEFCAATTPIVPTYLSVLFADMFEDLTYADMCPHTCDSCAFGEHCINIGTISRLEVARDQDDQQGANLPVKEQKISVCFLEGHHDPIVDLDADAASIDGPVSAPSALSVSIEVVHNGTVQNLDNGATTEHHLEHSLSIIQEWP
jgi:hypothetical protein